MTSRRSAKPLAAVVLVLCLAGMAVLGWLTWEELQDRRAGEAYYAALAQRPEGTPSRKRLRLRLCLRRRKPPCRRCPL